MPEDKEFDSDEVKAINEYIARAPEYFRKTDLLYNVFFIGDPVNNKPSLFAMIQSMQTILQSLSRLAWMVVGTVISVMIAAIVSGVILLMRLAPIIAQLESISRLQP